jgi:hypothetical protein
MNGVFSYARGMAKELVIQTTIFRQSLLTVSQFIPAADRFIVKYKTRHHAE